MRTPDGPLSALLRARSVAIIGASDDPTRIGGRPLRYLLDAAYGGTVYPVNPSRSHVQGLVSHPSIDDLPETPDLAIIAVGRDHVAGVVTECGRRGIGTAIVFAAGYAETDEAGRAAQDALRDVARHAGVRILGPNCNGTICPSTAATFAFTPVLSEGMPGPGSIAIAAQSAAVGTYWLRRLRDRRIGMHSLIHTGNEVDIGLGDVVDSLLDDPTVGVVLCALEQWRDPDRLVGLLDKIAASDVPMVVLRSGRTRVGKLAAASHTGGLTSGSPDLVPGLLRQAGAHVVGGLEQALLLASTLDVVGVPAWRRVGILSPSGGLGVLMADAMSAAGFEIPEMPVGLQARWRALVPFCGPRNPVDMTAQLVNQPQLYETFLRDMIESELIDLVAVFVPHGSADDALARALVAVAALAASRRVGVVAVGSFDDAASAWLREHGIVTFLDPEQAARTLAEMGQRHDPSREQRPSASSRPRPTPMVRPPQGVTSSELDVKARLAELSVDVVEDRVVGDARAAADAAAAFGVPVVLKVHEPGLAHKARAGGVVVGLVDPVDVHDHALRMLEQSKIRWPRDGEDGGDVAVRLLVEPFIQGDEAFVAVSRDPTWGLLALLGLGGVSIETRGDVAFRRAPLTLADIASMAQESPGLQALLSMGRRSDALGALERMFDALVVLAEPGIRVIELNPVMVLPDGRCIVVDALAEWS